MFTHILQASPILPRHRQISFFPSNSSMLDSTHLSHQNVLHILNWEGQENANYRPFARCETRAKNEHLFATNLLSCSFACSFCSGWILPSMEATCVTFSTIISHEDQGAPGQMTRVCLLAMQLKSWEGFGTDSSPLAAKLIKKERDAPLK